MAGDDAWHGTAPAEIDRQGPAGRRAARRRQGARFSFHDLCEKPLGARDYLAIAGRYDTIFIDHIPVLADGRRNEAKRLILLIDTLYDHGMRLVASAEARRPRSMPARAARRSSNSSAPPRA